VTSRGTAWLLPTVAVVVIGIAASVFGSLMLARSVDQRSHQAADASSVEIASTLRLAIEREQDLSVDAAGFILNNRSASEAQFQTWAASVRLFQRYPELQGIGEVVLVPASQLASFADNHGGSSFQVTPPGSRPYYCFTTLTQGRTSRSALPTGLDVCATALGSTLMTGRANGKSTYVPYGSGRNAALAIGTPVYQDGVVPRTSEGRNTNFVGWVGIQTLPGVLLRTALEGHPHTSITFRYRSGTSTATYRSGTPPAGAQLTGVNLHNGWQVTVATPMVGRGVFGHPVTFALLASGLLVSLLLGTLIVVLGTGRARALRLVAQRTEQLHHQALHDPLTGLPNRALILDRIGLLLAQSRRTHSQLGVLFVDLDDFKDVNDTLGHRTGDELLVAVGARLRDALRAGDTVGRLGGDEFVVATDGSSPDGRAAIVAERLLEAMTAPYPVKGSDAPLSVTASVGYVEAEGSSATPEELLQDADIALYEAKRAGKQQAIGFDRSMRTAVDDHRQLELDLRAALAGDEFYLDYQPTVNLTTGSITGVEALLRWRHPARGIVMPDLFIPTLESSGLINPVGAWVLAEACRQGAAWQRQGHRLTVSVNVSARQMERDRIADDVHRATAGCGFEPEMLALELTESSLMADVDETIARLQLLKAIGVRIAIDDFGTGFSSLAYLRKFPIDILKIDRSFVSGMSDSPEAAAIVHTLVELGKALGLETVAEGIETADQRARLMREDVDLGQGFLFARPMSVGALDALLSPVCQADVTHRP
jgi:diguanylate cyclase (GGDEF)-like protein